MMKYKILANNAKNLYNLFNNENFFTLFAW